jgi:hypothetical protein
MVPPAPNGSLLVTGDLRGRMTGLMQTLRPDKTMTRKELDAVMTLASAVIRQNTVPVADGWTPAFGWCGRAETSWLR